MKKYRNINIYKMMEQIEKIKRFDDLKEVLSIYGYIRSSKTLDCNGIRYSWEYRAFSSTIFTFITATVDLNHENVIFYICHKSYDAYTVGPFDIYNLPKSFVNTIIYGILSLDTKEGRDRLDFILNGYHTENIRSFRVYKLIEKLNSYMDRTKVHKITVSNDKCFIYSNTCTEAIRLSAEEIEELSEIVNVVPIYKNTRNNYATDVYDRSYENTEIFERDIYDSYNEYLNSLNF